MLFSREEQFRVFFFSSFAKKVYADCTAVDKCSRQTMKVQ